MKRTLATIGFMLFFSGHTPAEQADANTTGQPSQELSIKEKLALAQQFAPLAYLHPGEKYFPADVNTVARASVVKKRGDKKSIQLTQPGQLKSADDLKQFANQDNLYLDFGGDRNIYKGIPPVNGVEHAPLYFNVVETAPGKYLIQYLFFYAHNGALFIDIKGRGLGYHEGDWEHLDMHVTKVGDRYILDRIHYARHGTDHGDLVPADKVTYVDGHPVAYLAKLGHGAYPKPVKIISKDFDFAKKGAAWKTWENLVYTGTPDNPSPGNGWIAFKGRWGATRNKLNNSPTTPSDQNWWRQTAQRTTNVAAVNIKTLKEKTRASDYFRLLVRSRYQNICFELQYQDGKPLAADTQISYSIIERKRFTKNKVMVGNLGSGQKCFPVGKTISASDKNGYFVQIQKSPPQGQITAPIRLMITAPEK